MPGGSTRFAVVGGGISGLALGFGLTRRGADVAVLEASERPGGNIRSELRDGYRCEWGPNGFLDNEPATLRLVEALGLNAQLVRASDAAQRRWIVRGGRLRQLPASPGAFLHSDALSLAGRIRALFEWAPPPRREPGDESVFDFARRRIGREAAEVLVDAMVTGIYAGDARQLSLRSTLPRMRALEEEHGGLLRGMLAMRRERRRHPGGTEATRHAGGGPLGPGGTLTSFFGGMETLVLALSSVLGTRLRRRAPVAALRRTTHGWRLELQDGDTLDAEHVALACPAWTAAPILRPLDAALAGEVASIESAPVAVVSLGYAAADLREMPRGFGFLVPTRENLPLLGTLFDSWVFPQRAPEGNVLWRALLGGARDPQAVEASDADLIGRTRSTLEQLLGLRAEPQMTFVVRHRRGIPQYRLGHAERLERIDGHLMRHPGLILCGNSYRGVAMNACIREAELLASSLAPSAVPDASSRG